MDTIRPLLQPEEEHRAAKVCVIGQTVIENLMPDTFPLGKLLRIKSVPFTVIGGPKERGNLPGETIKMTIFVP